MWPCCAMAWASVAQRQLERFPALYQGSAIDTKPFFAKKAA